MKVFAVLSFFALVEGSCYDYEYYDPDTGASVPGNACARQAALASGATVAGQPAVVASTTLATPAFSAPYTSTIAPAAVATTVAAPAFATAAIPAAPVAAVSTFAAPYSTVAASYPVTTSYPVAASYPVVAPAATVVAPATTVVAPATTVATTVVAPRTVATPYTVAAAPVYGTATTTTAYPVAAAVTVRSPAVTVAARGSGSSSGSGSSLSREEIEYYRNLGERQAEQRRRNVRVVRESAEDLSRLSLFNRVIAGPGNAAPLFPALRLSLQKDVADAYKSEKRIANRNAEDAYQRYQRDPTRLNLLVSKYQDLNADLRDAAYQYNVVNSGTFGQRIAASSLFGNFGGGLFGGLTQILTQRQQSEDLNDIQRQMIRVQRQIQAEVQAQRSGAGAGASAGLAQGSVQQRLVAMSTYGPQRG